MPCLWGYVFNHSLYSFYILFQIPILLNKVCSFFFFLSLFLILFCLLILAKSGLFPHVLSDYLFVLHREYVCVKSSCGPGFEATSNGCLCFCQELWVLGKSLAVDQAFTLIPELSVFQTTWVNLNPSSMLDIGQNSYFFQGRLYFPTQTPA